MIGYREVLEVLDLGINFLFAINFLFLFRLYITLLSVLESLTDFIFLILIGELCFKSNFFLFNTISYFLLLLLLTLFILSSSFSFFSVSSLFKLFKNKISLFLVPYILNSGC